MIRMLRFRNQNASSIRSMTVTVCPDQLEEQNFLSAGADMSASFTSCKQTEGATKLKAKRSYHSDSDLTKMVEVEQKEENVCSRCNCQITVEKTKLKEAGSSHSEMREDESPVLDDDTLDGGTGVFCDQSQPLTLSVKHNSTHRSNPSQSCDSDELSHCSSEVFTKQEEVKESCGSPATKSSNLKFPFPNRSSMKPGTSGLESGSK